MGFTIKNLVLAAIGRLLLLLMLALFVWLLTVIGVVSPLC